MANSKARCSGCKDYFPREQLRQQGLSGVCSEACKRGLLDKHRTKTKRKATVKAARKTRAKDPENSTKLRATIRRRDGNVCRFCGQAAYRLEVHHIEYRSQGGQNWESNLITLCDDHHRLVHSNKRKWQPILRAVIWAYYVEGRKVTVPAMEARVKRAGVLVEMADDLPEASA